MEGLARRPVAIVFGGAECVHEDYRRLLEQFPNFTPARIYACNDIGAHLERLDVWATLHPEMLQMWMAKRRERGLNGAFETVSTVEGQLGPHAKHPVDRRLTHLHPGQTGSASSGGFATKVALHDGYDAILCGIPMRREDGNIERKVPWKQRDAFISGWEKSIPHFRNRVKSMSGWTMMVLGPPTPEWLAGQASSPSEPPI